MRARAIVVVAGVAVIALAAAVLGRGPVATVARCEPVRGGTPGAQAQLRYLDADDGHVTFTFGRSAGPNEFAVPEFVLEQVATPADTDGARTFALRLIGASLTNPDGSPSYFGPTALRPGADGFTRLALIGDLDRTMEWRIAVGRAACPTSEADTYTLGLTPRAQLILTIGERRTVTVEPASRPTAGGSGTGFRSNTPVTVTGHGFPGGAAVTVALGSRVLAETTASPGGAFVVGAYIPPDAAPGLYTIAARDAGGSATVPFTVTLPPKPLELQP